MAVKKWLDEYQTISWEIALVSQLASFLIPLFALLSLYSLLKAGYNVPEYVESHQKIFLVAVFFHILAAVVFGARFVLLFFNSKKSFWLSQLIWIVGLITLFAWCAYTKDNLLGFFYVAPQPHSLCFDCDETNVFLYSSRSFEYLGSFYFFISPIRQFFTFIISVFKRY